MTDITFQLFLSSFILKGPVLTPLPLTSVPASSPVPWTPFLFDFTLIRLHFLRGHEPISCHLLTRDLRYPDACEASVFFGSADRGHGEVAASSDWSDNYLNLPRLVSMFNAEMRRRKTSPVRLRLPRVSNV